MSPPALFNFVSATHALGKAKRCHCLPTSNAAATSVKLLTDNQKNGHHGDTIHQEVCESDFCPVRSVAALVSAIMAQKHAVV